MKLWKKFVGTAAVSVLAVSLAACGEESSSGGGDSKTLVIGASNVPHAQILEHVQKEYEAKGYKLEIKKFQDYVLPNKALAEKEIDANYFQHVPYLEQQEKENKDYKFASAGGVHVEPLGVYSKKYKSLDKLPKGATILTSSNVAERGRVLTFLQNEGLIKLKDGKTTDAQLKDIVENPKKIKFKTNIEASLLPQAYKNNEGDAVLINTNYAIDNGLNPLKDTIALEDESSPYVNIIVTRDGDEKDKRVTTLLDILHEKKNQDWITKEYKGAVVPVSK
ncbi:MetQ/NlpA family ABC transporter substrate-binding protein [Exiguobacterium sp. Helios]|uniref:MetQ/NlpA family ABC transporter substrate-binding protein n=1 Tax=Exiguobacterium sp. Helios TaxID=2735868 RepID=UPI00165DAA25|nr:MetQ/NlpA family ABC transporter substrate-binding protein [Exiguobacterium sp. Helios]QNR21905.1 MetQ/NlpA family ABC transporter substrate-binding protein [Exiguobacterium sp. Helios]